MHYTKYAPRFIVWTRELLFFFVFSNVVLIVVSTIAYIKTNKYNIITNN